MLPNLAKLDDIVRRIIRRKAIFEDLQNIAFGALVMMLDKPQYVENNSHNVIIL